MNKTSLLSLAALLATSAVLCESSSAAVHSGPDLGNSLEQRIERMGPEAWAVMKRSGISGVDTLARAWAVWALPLAALAAASRAIRGCRG